MALDRGHPPNLGKYTYIINLKLTTYSWRKISGGLVCDFWQLELPVITEQIGLLCRQDYLKESKQASKHAGN